MNLEKQNRVYLSLILFCPEFWNIKGIDLINYNISNLPFGKVVILSKLYTFLLESRFSPCVISLRHVSYLELN